MMQEHRYEMRDAEQKHPQKLMRVVQHMDTTEFRRMKLVAFYPKGRCQFQSQNVFVVGRSCSLPRQQDWLLAAIEAPPSMNYSPDFLPISVSREVLFCCTRVSKILIATGMAIILQKGEKWLLTEISRTATSTAQQHRRKVALLAASIFP
jgi:hypothetical protein